MGGRGLKRVEVMGLNGRRVKCGGGLARVYDVSGKSGRKRGLRTSWTIKGRGTYVCTGGGRSMGRIPFAPVLFAHPPLSVIVRNGLSLVRFAGGMCLAANQGGDVAVRLGRLARGSRTE